MPFAYYGSKHGLASKYPRPVHDLVIEPFAGAAGYSCYWAHLGRRHLLNDLDGDVVTVLRRIKNTAPACLLSEVNRQLDQSCTTDVMLVWICGGKAGRVVGPRVVNERMRAVWPNVFKRISRVHPDMQHWDILNGDYRDLPDVEATWFIDPPYQPHDSTAGSGYRLGSSGINYDELAQWCQTRRGQVIVCEQSPATWLPFTYLANQKNGASADSSSRAEVVWLSQQQQLGLFD